MRTRVGTAGTAGALDYTSRSGGARVCSPRLYARIPRRLCWERARQRRACRRASGGDYRGNSRRKSASRGIGCMILCDTGPLVALLSQDDPQHARCVEALRALPAQPFLTTLPCFGEAIYLLRRIGGHAAQDRLWSMRRDGKLIVHFHSDSELSRMEELMRRYRDIPMDFADASLVVLAETTGFRRVFTLDTHFYAYRVGEREVFEVIP